MKTTTHIFFASLLSLSAIVVVAGVLFEVSTYAVWARVAVLPEGDLHVIRVYTPPSPSFSSPPPETSSSVSVPKDTSDSSKPEDIERDIETTNLSRLGKELGAFGNTTPDQHP